MARPASHDADIDLPLFGGRRAAEIVLFPSCRRIKLVERIARHMASLPPDRVDSYLEIALSALADKHRSAEIAAPKAEADIAKLGAVVLDRYAALVAEEAL